MPRRRLMAARVRALFHVDLDGFKAVNDQARHAAGDQVLVDVAHALRAAVRENDVIARLGCDECCILTHEPAKAQDARGVSDKVLNALNRIQVPGHASLRIHAAPHATRDQAASLKLPMWATSRSA